MPFRQRQESIKQCTASLCLKEIKMTDREIHDLLIKCKLKSRVPWDILVSQFSYQLVALSDRLTEDELYSLIDIAVACYQKGYEEFAAGQEAESLLNGVRRRSRGHT